MKDLCDINLIIPSKTTARIQEIHIIIGHIICKYIDEKKSKKVNLWLLGGFGNVLFQLFFARLLSNNNYKVILIDNLTSKNFLTRLIG